MADDPIPGDDAAPETPPGVADPVTANGGRSIADRAEEGENEQTVFPLGVLPGDKRTLRTLIKAGQPVEVTCSIRSAEVPVREGLLDPDKRGKLLITYLPEKYEEVPTREEERVVGWKARTTVRPIYIEPVTEDASAIEASFVELLAREPSRAGELLDRMREHASEVLATA